MFRIGNYKKGSNLTLLNTIYHRPTKLADGKYSSDSIDLIIKDVDTNSTKVTAAYYDEKEQFF